MVSVLMPGGRVAVDERADRTGGKVPFKDREEGVEERCEGDVGKGETVVDDKLVGRVEGMPLAISKLALMRYWANVTASGVPVIVTDLSVFPSCRLFILIVAPDTFLISWIFDPPFPITQPIRVFGMVISCVVCAAGTLGAAVSGASAPAGVKGDWPGKANEGCWWCRAIWCNLVNSG